MGFARGWVAAWTGAVVVGSAAAWDVMGWDRGSPGGSRAFALGAFGVVAGLELVWIFALAPVLGRGSIAAERDRKTLDSLLASRFSAAELILGAVGVGLLRTAQALLASAPPVALLVGWGGIDLRLVGLVGLGLASTAVFLASSAAWASAGGRTAATASTAAGVLLMAWLGLPPAVVMILPRLWPAGSAWADPPALLALDSSPVGVALDLVGILPRATLVGSVLRMVALQGLASAVLIGWAIAGLRPASRAIHDGEGRSALRRRLRGRWRPRPPCGDDPVLWLELHPSRGAHAAARLADGIALALWFGSIAWAVSLFAGPAFAELARLGYRAIPGRPSVPDLTPIARVLLGKLNLFRVAAAAGTARLEFNVVLRQASWLFGLIYFMLVAGNASEGFWKERTRDTWLGLIATPLTGAEILRAKRIGAIRKAWFVALPLLGFWAVGLASGAVHPVGFIAAVAGLAASTWFLAGFGLSAALRSTDQSRVFFLTLAPAMVGTGLAAIPFILPGLPGVLIAATIPPFQAYAAPLSFEDVAALGRSGVPPQFAAIGVESRSGAWLVVAAWLGSVGAQVGAGRWLFRSACRGFDAAVGRPTRPIKGDPRASSPAPCPA